MKFFSFAVFSIFATTSFAQNIVIGAPANNSNVFSGQNLTVEIRKPNGLTGSQEVAIVIAMNRCTDACPSPSNDLGPILYNGPYNPQSTELGFSNQSFAVQVPSLDKGKVILSVTHLSLLGAGPYPLLEFENITLNFE